MIVGRLRWPPGTHLMVRQLAGAWLCGSMLMGTVAWGFLSAQITAVPAATRLARYAPCPGHGAPCAYPSFFACTAGGLPFALVAALLLRPWRVNMVAGGVYAGLVAGGFLMVSGRPVPQNVFLLYADYARSFFSGGSAFPYY